MTDIPMKRCSTCGNEFPATSEYFYLDHRNKKPRRHCKRCTNKLNAEYQAANRERLREYHRAWHEKNRERVNALARQRYHKSPEVRARMLEATRRWARKNPQRRLQKNRNWRKLNPEKRREYNNRRRILELSAQGTYTTKDIQAQYKRQKGRCYYAACGHSKLGNDYHVDHVVPISKGGTSDPSNLVLACPSCNSRKANKQPHEWVEGGRLL